MTIAINVYNAMKAWQQSAARNAKDFVKNNPDTWKIVKMVLDMSADNG